MPEEPLSREPRLRYIYFKHCVIQQFSNFLLGGWSFGIPSQLGDSGKYLVMNNSKKVLLTGVYILVGEADSKLVNQRVIKIVSDSNMYHKNIINTIAGISDVIRLCSQRRAHWQVN